MRVALVGFSQGYYAVEYTRYLSRLREAVITAVCDLGKDETYVRSCAFVEAGVFAREMGAPLTHTLEETLATKPEAVLLCCETAGAHITGGKGTGSGRACVRFQASVLFLRTSGQAG